MLSHSKFLKAALLCIAPLNVAAQQASFASQTSTAQNVPPGWVDGSQHPELVPDSAAYRLVLLSLRAPTDQSGLARYSAKWKKLGLSPADTQAAQTIVSQFAAQYSAWQTQTEQTVHSAAPGAIPPTGPAAIIQHALTALNNLLSPEGSIQFSKFVQAAKARMIVHP